VAAPVVVVALVVVAWLLDERVSDGRVPRNTELAGEPVGGLGRADLEPVVARLADRYAAGSPSSSAATTASCGSPVPSSA
jgi:hypothetical protein